MCLKSRSRILITLLTLSPCCFCGCTGASSGMVHREGGSEAIVSEVSWLQS
jgi:hypothetical protein